jgi:hypothetical protein
MPYLINSNKIGRSVMKVLGILLLVLLAVGIILYLMK